MDRGESAANATRGKWLLFRVGVRICAMPLPYVAETMRALPATRLAGIAGIVTSASVIRGMPVPVIDAGTLFGEPEAARARLVTIDAGARQVALAVDEVLGVGEIAEDLLQELPPLLREAAADAVRAIGVLDGAFLVRLEAGRLVPDGAPDMPGPFVPDA